MANHSARQYHKPLIIRRCYNTRDTIGGETLGSASVCQSSKTALSFELEKESEPSTIKEAESKNISPICDVEELDTLIAEYARDSSMPSSGEFFYYYGLGNFRRSYLKQEKDWEGFNQSQTLFCERMFILAHDFDMLMTIIHKIEWLTEQLLQERLTQADWAVYVQADVHLFHAEIRSIFDSVARGALIVAGNKAGQLNEQSFDGLRTFCSNYANRADAFFGQELADALRAVEWFQQSRKMRDDLVHNEKDINIGYIPMNNVIVFRTLFGIEQRDIYQGPEQFVRPDGWIFLRPYMGYYVGRLWHFLNIFTKFSGAKLALEKGGYSWVPKRLEPTISSMKQAVSYLQNDLLLQK